MENWFSIDDVTKNCQKRREVQGIILTVMKEQGRALPPGISLPDIKFAISRPEIQNNTSIHQPRIPQNNVQQYHQMQTQRYYNNQNEDVTMELDEDIGEELDDEDLFPYEESEGGQYHAGQHGQYSYHRNEYHQDVESSQDRRHYYSQIEENDQWSEDQQEADYHSE